MKHPLSEELLASIQSRAPKIAISGKSGCGNTTVSGLVARRLGFQVINYTFRNLARDRGMSFQELHTKAGQDPAWDRYLDAKQVELAGPGNCVLGSRLAIWILEDADLRVYLTASPDVRAERIRQREGGSLQEVLEETRIRDQKDHRRYQDLYGIDNNDYAFSDLIINTDGLLPGAIAGIISQALIEKLNLPSEVS